MLGSWQGVNGRKTVENPWATVRDGGRAPVSSGWGLRAKRGSQIWLRTFVRAYRHTRIELTKNLFHTFQHSYFCNAFTKLILSRPIASCYLCQELRNALWIA